MADYKNMKLDDEIMSQMNGGEGSDEAATEAKLAEHELKPMQ